ncbi:MAG: glycosyltransferase, partial [Chitinivibrionales bacterium]|nr:glycosyltransferase [Chitinivibrionales bacterium]
MPKVTVLMSVYNGQKYLREAINSILQQTFQNFELLIINDGSSDTTHDIISSYQDQRIRLHTNEKNIGLTRSLNIGLGLAQGEYIARQDADDISLPRRLEQEIVFLEQHDDIWLVGTAFHLINEQGKLLGTQGVLTDNTAIRTALLKANQFGHGTVMYRKALIHSVGYYREELGPAEDYDLWLRIAEKYKVANLSEPLYQWRVNPKGVSVTQKMTQDNYVEFARELAIERKKYGKDILQATPQDQLRSVMEKRFSKTASNSTSNYFLSGKFLYEKGAYREAFSFFMQSLFHEKCH